jgi:hypothetical protein
VAPSIISPKKRFERLVQICFNRGVASQVIFAVKAPASGHRDQCRPSHRPMGDKPMMRRDVSIFSMLVAALFCASAASASSLNDLPGKWSGWGSIQLANGNTERVKCVAEYAVRGSTNVQQNLRCASQSYKIDATAKLNVANGEVSGDWEEKSFQAVGSVAGKANGGNFNLSIQGLIFSAAMAVATNGCKQSINITPQGFDISKISIGLGRC